jgi:hypothetical protein
MRDEKREKSKKNFSDVLNSDTSEKFFSYFFLIFVQNVKFFEWLKKVKIDNRFKLDKIEVG